MNRSGQVSQTTPQNMARLRTQGPLPPPVNATGTAVVSDLCEAACPLGIHE